MTSDADQCQPDRERPARRPACRAAKFTTNSVELAKALDRRCDREQRDGVREEDEHLSEGAVQREFEGHWKTNDLSEMGRHTDKKWGHCRAKRQESRRWSFEVVQLAGASLGNAAPRAVRLLLSWIATGVRLFNVPGRHGREQTACLRAQLRTHLRHDYRGGLAGGR